MDRLRKIVFASLLFTALQLSAADTININTADAETLTAIQGIGEKRAAAIVKYRSEHGPFASVDDLMNVDGVGQVTVDNNRQMLTVGKD